LGPPPPRPFTLSWSHYVFLLRVKDPNERSFYAIEATEQNWTVRHLKRQFDSGLYERLALSRDLQSTMPMVEFSSAVFTKRSK
jgi:predicted nuclease of restriction endonuclease-like (RecB) superfamily